MIQDDQIQMSSHDVSQTEKMVYTHSLNVRMHFSTTKYGCNLPDEVTFKTCNFYTAMTELC